MRLTRTQLNQLRWLHVRTTRTSLGMSRADWKRRMDRQRCFVTLHNLKVAENSADAFERYCRTMPGFWAALVQIFGTDPTDPGIPLREAFRENDSQGERR